MKLIKSNKIFYILPVLILVQLNLIAQTKGSIKGAVFDKANNNGIKNVNIYLAYTLIGTTSDSGGNFEIPNVPQGTYEIVFSHVNYQRNSFSIQIIEGRTTELEITLLPKIYELKTVPILSEDVDEWRDNLEIFKERLIGTSTLAEEVDLLNPEIINFKKNEEGNLTAFTDKPLKLINNALGYSITYYLTYFEASEFTTKYAGIPIFKELEPADNSTKKEWIENRKSVYLGSLRHFLTLVCDNYDSSLYYKAKLDSINSQFLFLRTDETDNIKSKYKYFSGNNYLNRFGFKILSQTEVESKYLRKMFLEFNINKHLEPGKISNEVNFINVGNLKILYNYENPDINYSPGNNRYPTSTIKFHADTVAVDRKGRYFAKFMIQTTGYWGFERLAETIPYEYELPISDK